jgi:hypothetical protein
MINKSDLHTTTFESKLSQTNPSGPVLGRTIIHYSVSRFIDVRNLVETRSFLVTCVQRLIVPNPHSFKFETLPPEYDRYPALLLAKTTPTFSGGTVTLVDYWPRTINSNVSVDTSQSLGGGTQVTRQHSSGSSVTTTNSFGVNASLTGGLSAEGPNASETVGGNFEHSTAVMTSAEQMAARTVDRNVQLTGGANMTIKDWAGYARIKKHSTIEWVWGQEYPLDFFQFRPSSGTAVKPPDFVTDRLWDSKTWLAPPSHLSMFGLDLVVRATWLVVPAPESAQFPELVFAHSGKLGFGTHKVSGEGLDIQFNHETYTVGVSPPGTTPPEAPPPPLDLDLLALDPVGGTGADNGAAVGFSPETFDYWPATPAGTFRITSAANTLVVRGTGFSPGTTKPPGLTTLASASAVNATSLQVASVARFSTRQTIVIDSGTAQETGVITKVGTAGVGGTGLTLASALTAAHALGAVVGVALPGITADLSSGGTASLQIMFKVIDTDEEYALILKHWKTTDAGVAIVIDINGVQIVRHVDELEGEGGANNVTKIPLRSFDFTSTNYHDYLRLGLNRISVTASAEDSTSACGYVLRALAVG